MSYGSFEKGVNFLRKETFSGLFILFLCLSSTVGAHGQAVQTITVKGESWFEERDGLMDKDRAVKDALSGAVEQTVETMISPETSVQDFQLLNDEIYMKAERYIQDYKIIGENQGTHIYEVTIEATVATGSIKEKLDALGLLWQQAGKPRILILIAEQNNGNQDYSYSWGLHQGERADLRVAENTIMDHFREKGFELVDYNAAAFQLAELNDPAAITLGKEVDAEVVIVGKALAEYTGNIAGTSMKSLRADISLRAIQTDNGRVLSSAAEHAAAVHVDEVTAGAEALKKAGAKISEKMIGDIIKNFQKRNQEINP
jgi:hypothetical protein